MPPNELEQLAREIGKVAAAVRDLGRRVSRIEDQQAIVSKLKPLADVAAELMALKTHAEALAKLADYAPVIIESVERSNRHEIFYEELWSRLGSKSFLRAIAVVIIGALTTALAIRYLKGG